MLVDAIVGGRTHRVEVTGGGGRYTVSIDGQAFEVDHRPVGGPFVSLLVAGRSHEAAVERTGSGYTVLLRRGPVAVELREPGGREAGAQRAAPEGSSRVTAPMPGKIVRVLVQPGQVVSAGEGLVVMEAMKMENELRAPRAGRVREVHARAGLAVETGALLVLLE